MSRLITLQVEIDEYHETLQSLAVAMGALTDATLVCLFDEDRERNQKARRCLIRLYWNLTRHRTLAADEEEVTLLARCQFLLRLFARRLGIGEERSKAEVLADRLGRAIQRREGYEEFWDGGER